jgi:hypothetical protein
MFITRDEKKYLFDQIKALAREQSIMASDITFLKAKIKVLEVKPTPVVAKKPKTIAQKKKQAEYMRTYMAKKKAAKLALEQK